MLRHHIAGHGESTFGRDDLDMGAKTALSAGNWADNDEAGRTAVEKIGREYERESYPCLLMPPCWVEIEQPYFSAPWNRAAECRRKCHRSALLSA